MLFPPKKFKLLFVAFLISLSLAFFLYRSFRPLETGYLTRIIWEVVLPAQYLVKASLTGLVTTWEKYIFLVGREAQNEQLRRENAELREQNIKLSYQNRELQLELQRLHKLLGMSPPPGSSVIIARVISRGQSPFSRHFFVDQGTLRGVKAGLPVVTEAGVVGRVTETSLHLSKVMLITDRQSRIDALTQEERLHGILQGVSSEECLLKYIPRDKELTEGSLVITSGLSGIFPKGLLLGKISRVAITSGDMFKEVFVRPLPDLAKLEEVAIILPGWEGRR